MDMLENKSNAKRRMPRVTKVVLAAALAVGCVLSIAAGLPTQVYNFMSGGQAIIEPGSATFTFSGEETGPLTVENGRLWFESDGEKIDITDKVDENTPYIQEHVDPATGNKGYVVAGGTIDDYGWAEFFMMEDGTCSVIGMDAWVYFARIDGKQIPLHELTEAELDMLDNGGIPLYTVNRPWLDKAVAQLDLEVGRGLVNDLVDPLVKVKR